MAVVRLVQHCCLNSSEGARQEADFLASHCYKRLTQVLYREQYCLFYTRLTLLREPGEHRAVPGAVLFIIPGLHCSEKLIQVILPPLVGSWLNLNFNSICLLAWSGLYKGAELCRLVNTFLEAGVTRAHSMLGTVIIRLLTQVNPSLSAPPPYLPSMNCMFTSESYLWISPSIFFMRITSLWPFVAHVK